MFLTEGQMSDHKGARLMSEALPAAKALLGDRGYESNGFRAALADQGIEACIPSSKSRTLGNPPRKDALPPTPQDREHVRQAERLATHRDPLRPMRPHLLIRHLHRRCGDVPAVFNQS